MKKQKKQILRYLVVAALFVSLGSVAIMLCPGTASAIPVYTGTYADMYLKQNTFPSGLSEEKVYFDAAISDTIIGHVGSQTDLRLVTFTSTTDTLDGKNGFATIGAQDGFLNKITITATGYKFEDLIFSVSLAPNQNDDLIITAYSVGGGIDTFAGWTAEKDWGPGENRILVQSKSGNFMESITIESIIGGDETLGGLEQLKQVEISGFTSTTVVPPVPEPATMLLLGLGLVGLAGVRRFKK